MGLGVRSGFGLLLGQGQDAGGGGRAQELVVRNASTSTHGRLSEVFRGRGRPISESRGAHELDVRARNGFEATPGSLARRNLQQTLKSTLRRNSLSFSLSLSLCFVRCWTETKEEWAQRSWEQTRSYSPPSRDGHAAGRGTPRGGTAPCVRKKFRAPLPHVA